MGFVVDTMSLEQVFSEFFGFLCHVNPPWLSMLILAGGITKGWLVAAVQRLSLTPST
jgi:hypothetical protein